METEKEIDVNGPAEVRRRGRLVFVALAVLTVVEFGISVWLGGVLPALALIALAKAALIIVYFMHAGELGAIWRQEWSQ